MTTHPPCQSSAAFPKGWMFGKRLFGFKIPQSSAASASLTVSFFLLNTGMATVVMSSRLWAWDAKSCHRTTGELVSASAAPQGAPVQGAATPKDPRCGLKLATSLPPTLLGKQIATLLNTLCPRGLWDGCLFLWGDEDGMKGSEMHWRIVLMKRQEPEEVVVQFIPTTLCECRHEHLQWVQKTPTQTAQNGEKPHKYEQNHKQGILQTYECHKWKVPQTNI